MSWYLKTLTWGTCLDADEVGDPCADLRERTRYLSRRLMPARADFTRTTALECPRCGAGLPRPDERGYSDCKHCGVVSAVQCGVEQEPEPVYGPVGTFRTVDEVRVSMGLPALGDKR